MWIGQDGEVNVELNWDDPWVIFEPALKDRIESLREAELESLNSALWDELLGVMLGTREHFLGQQLSEESEFEGNELPRRTFILNTTDASPVAQVVIPQVLNQPWRWRADVIQTATEALSQMEE